MTMVRKCTLLLAAAGCASGFMVPGIPLRRSTAVVARPLSPSHTTLQMGFFDAIGKAISESMSNDASLSKPVNPGFREGYEGPEKKKITFQPSGAVISTYAGERLGDVCARGAVDITYGCQKGTCGSCEVYLLSNGSREKVRVCQGVVPRGDLADLIIEVTDPEITIKRKRQWEQIKAANAPK